MSTARLAATGGLLLLLSWLAATVRADPFAFRGRVELGRPAKPATVTVTEHGDRVELEVEGSRTPLPISAPQRADVQTIRLANGALVGLVRVTAAESREVAALLSRRAGGRAELLWAGALDARGDPGERRGHLLELQDQTGDGQADVVVGQFDERARICGQARTLLRPRAVDPESLRLRPVLLSRLPAQQGESPQLLLTEQSPGPTQAPLTRSLRLRGVSSQPGADAEPWLASLPTTLTDGDPATYWGEGHGSGGRGEFATFQWDASGLDIRALAIVPLPAALASDDAVSIARTVWLVGDDGTRIKLKFPERLQPGRRYWAVPQKPLAWHCISIVFEESAPLHAGKVGPAVLAEVEAYSELDFGGGVDRLVQALAAGGARAGEAAHVLSTLGPGIVPKLQAAWPTLSGAARRRVVRVVAPQSESDAAAREMLGTALADNDAEVRDAAFAALLEAGPAGRTLLLPRVAETGESGDAAALALARRAPQEAIAPLLAALALDRGSERARLREAIALCARSGGEAVTAALRSWVDAGSANVAARASLAAALAAQGVDSARSLAAELLAAAAPQATEFNDRWRLVQAARTLPANAEVDTWLAGLAKDEERWMLRAAAVEALAERRAEAAAQVAASALRDAYPRVRMGAATALAGQPGALSLLSQHAQRDRWPMVRAAALDALATQPGAEPVLRKGLEDGSRMARAAAIRSLTKIGARGAWPLIAARLEDKEEWPEVLTEGVAFARELCIAEAAKPLLALLRRGMKPDAWTPDAELALLAFEALIQLGGDAAKSATRLANSPGAPASFKAAVEARSTYPATCRSGG